MISEEDVEQALHFITDNSEAHARAKTRVKSLEHRFRVVEAQGFRGAEGTQEARKAASRTTSEYLALMEEHDEAWYEFQKLDTDMEYARLVIDLFRTYSANLRGG